MARQSQGLAQEIEAMRRLEAAMSPLPDKTKTRVAQWFVDNFVDPPAGFPEAPSIPEGPTG